jgi:predicted tellurium resistance membrane protein TerC
MAIELMTFGRVKCVKKSQAKKKHRKKWSKHIHNIQQYEEGQKKSFWGKVWKVMNTDIRLSF